MSNANEDKDGILYSQSRIYRYTNEMKGPEWYEHKNFEPVWNLPDSYFLMKKVGRGKYSTVFKGTKNKKKLRAIKILVPLDPKRYLREIKILTNLRGGPNIVSLTDLVRDPATNIYSFVFEWVEFFDWKTMYQKFDIDQIRIVIYKILKALAYSHSNGIMHRDIKPQNIAIDPKTLKVRLLDWGLADFYHPKQRYSSHVATRVFKPPELLIDYPYYDYSMDIWSLGLTFAIMMFGRSPIQSGENDRAQLSNMADFVGGRTIVEYSKSLHVPLDDETIEDLKSRTRRGLTIYANKVEPERCPPKAMALLRKMLTVDHRQRITADDALRDPFFDEINHE